VLSLQVQACGGSPDAGGGDGELSRRAQPLAAPQTFLCGASHGSGDAEPCSLFVEPIDANTVHYRIFQPVVDVTSQDYFVYFQPGDTVQISGGGCVQTGGIGSTWKRYINPSGDNSDQYYFGTITIPGTFLEMTPLAYAPSTVTVANLESPTCVLPSSFPLSLGYKDDELGDNGYYDHDDGNDDQCALENDPPGLGNAYLDLTVTHGVPGPWPNAANFDLVPACLDENYLFLNPRWGWQYDSKESSYDPDTVANETTQPTYYDSPEGTGCGFSSPNDPCASVSLPEPYCKPFKVFGCPVLNPLHRKGHRNWMAATYTGTVQWSGHDSWDDDYNILLQGPKAPGTNFFAGVTKELPSNIKLEFDSDETTDEFAQDDKSGVMSHWWWKRFNEKVDSSDDEARDWIDGSEAVVIGLMGVDESHEPGSELHPTFALAMRTPSRAHLPPCSPDHYFDHWAIFARNWGNEGYCSSHDHYLLLNAISLRLPPSDLSTWDASMPPIVQFESFKTKSCHPGSVEFVPSPEVARPGMIFTFSLPEPSEHQWVAGSVEVGWPLKSPHPSNYCDVTPPPTGTGQQTASASASDPTEPGDLDDLLNALTPAQRVVFLNLAPQMVPQQPAVTLADIIEITAVPGTTAPPTPTQVPVVEAALPSRRTLEKHLGLGGAACIATGAQIPGEAADVCEAYPPFTEISTSGGQPGNDGWLVTPLTVTLIPHDASGKGIDHTELTFDSVSFAWTQYSSPFVTPEGDVSLVYRSADLAGNIEGAKLRRYLVDTVAPTATVSTLPVANGVLLSYAIDDPVPGSGPRGLHVIWHGASGPMEGFLSGGADSVTLDSTCTEVEYWAEDVAGNLQDPHGVVPDTIPPVLTVNPQSFCLWPPNHERLRFALGTEISATAVDGCDPAPTVRIVSLTSTEPSAGSFDFSDAAACVTRERLGSGTGRTYHVTIEAKDYSGNVTQKVVDVVVPHSATSGCGAGGTEIASNAPCL
jgi:hypothetical protein